MEGVGARHHPELGGAVRIESLHTHGAHPLAHGGLLQIREGLGGGRDSAEPMVMLRVRRLLICSIILMSVREELGAPSSPSWGERGKHAGTRVGGREQACRHSGRRQGATMPDEWIAGAICRSACVAAESVADLWVPVLLPR
jgi:hypothetical protein